MVELTVLPAKAKMISVGLLGCVNPSPGSEMLVMKVVDQKMIRKTFIEDDL